MTHQPSPFNGSNIADIEDLSRSTDYSLMSALKPDPQSTELGDDHEPRQVFSGHYVPVKPTPIADPVFVAHSSTLFRELGFDDAFAGTEDFIKVFSGDLSHVPEPMYKFGWATGYALSIYGTEYIQQCPFHTGNGYGDGRAMSVVEGVFSGKRWEKQLKGGGPTPYCRGADGRAVLRSSVREFLAQEHMHALGVPTSRSLSLIASKTETVSRPWYSEDSNSTDPDVMVSEAVAISTRVAPSFLRVGQLELFGRRARSNAHPEAMEELEQILLHIIEREYKGEINDNLPLQEKALILADKFCQRLTSLVTHWLRVGYCQGNFNSDNCALGGFTLDYGPFGFMERFEPFYQPWTGGGRHFSFLNQPSAAKANFDMFCVALQPLLANHQKALEKLEEIRTDFVGIMQRKMESMWASKLGLETFDSELFTELLKLMVETSVDYTRFFRELSDVPEKVSSISDSFYQPASPDLLEKWQEWLDAWRSQLGPNFDAADISTKMKRVNPKFTWREWFVVPAYKQARKGDYTLIHELQDVLGKPYDEQSSENEREYYQLRPSAFERAGGVSHYSCSS